MGRLKGRILGEQVVDAIALRKIGDAKSGAENRILYRLPSNSDARLKIGDAVVLMIQSATQAAIVEARRLNLSRVQIVVNCIAIRRGARSVYLPAQAEVQR